MPAAQANPFDVMADVLDTMAHALQYASSVNGNTSRPSSPAAWENTGGPCLAGEWSSNPVLNANLSAGLLATSATDHAQGLAAVLRMDAGGIFTTYTVARGLLENASRAWYLLEPGIDPRERVRRHMNERLHSLNEARLLTHGMGQPATEQDDQQRKILEAAREHSFSFQTSKNYKAARLGEARPSAMKLADACVSGLGEGVGSTIYRLLSAQAHGVAYGIMQLLGEPSTAQEMTKTPGVTMQQVRHASSDVAQRLLIPTAAYVAMTQRYLQHQGWDASAWQQAAQEGLRRWVHCATAPPDPSATSSDT